MVPRPQFANPPAGSSESYGTCVRFAARHAYSCNWNTVPAPDAPPRNVVP